MVAAVGAVAMLTLLSQTIRHVWPGKQPAPTFITFQDARGRVPDELKGFAREEVAAGWPVWIAAQDANARSRVAKGDEDSLANFLLYGTSFTTQPRITDDYRASLVRKLGDEAAADRELSEVMKARAIDLARALASPGDDERRLTMREIATRAARDTRTPEEQMRLAQYLFDNLARFLNENRAFAMEAAAAKAMNPSANPLSTLYRTRGLSGDTSILVEHAVERALKDIDEAALLPPGSVRVAGVVGPGMDLIDKHGGYDLHPPQTTQPWMLMDTLMHLGLANASELQVFTFDVSARINQHLSRAVRRARDHRAYVLHLVRDDAWGWTPDAVRFWAACGSRVGTAGDSTSATHPAGVASRTIQVRPEWVVRLRPVDLNIVCQRLILPDDERLDLLIATNILCYYDPFQQDLALLNAASMLRPGGILLSTEPLPESADSGMRRVGSTTVTTSSTGGFTIYWYQCSR